MKRKSLIIPALTALACAAFGAPAFAQEADAAMQATPTDDAMQADDAMMPADKMAPDDQMKSEDDAMMQEASGDAMQMDAMPAAEEAPIDPDNMAAYLNAQQKIQQKVKLTRSIDGQVVETKEKTLTYSKDDPLTSTEAGQTALEKLKAEFDSETLTRKEAVDEAKLDFVVADTDRDGKMTPDEFAFLVEGWQSDEVEGGGRDRFVDPVQHASAEEAKSEHEKQARAKFAFMAGDKVALSSKQYLKAAMFDFDTFDTNNDGVLTGQELLHYREANRGEPVSIGEPGETPMSADEPQE
ncbi:MAG: hypothetical protein R3C60_08070 [Parvularculaceae bacterium]